MNLTGSATLEYKGILPYIHDGGGGGSLHYFPRYYLRSTVFFAGGYYWCAWVYPTDTWSATSATVDSFSATLKLMSTGVRVTAAHELSVLDPSAILPPKPLSSCPPSCFASDDNHSGDDDQSDYRHMGGMDLNQFVGYVRRSATAASLFQSTVTVFVPEHPPIIELPPSDMLGQLGGALETTDGADVTFSVDGELFPAHRIILAVRSPVFKAELYGGMKENGVAQTIAVDDLRADAFRALLRYIYTDDVVIGGCNNNYCSRQEDAANGGQDDDDSEEVWELLAAADRYHVERLKVICERILCKRLEVDNVAETLALADRHHCDTLKDACIEFMTTSGRMCQVAATPGYGLLKLLIHVFCLKCWRSQVDFTSVKSK